MDDFVDPFTSVASLTDANLHESLLQEIFSNDSSAVLERNTPKSDLCNVAPDEIFLSSKAYEGGAQVAPHHSLLPNSDVRYGTFGQEDQMQQHHIHDYDISLQTNDGISEETSSFLYLQALANLQSSSSISQLSTTTCPGVSTTMAGRKSSLQSTSYVDVGDSAKNLVPNSNSNLSAANPHGMMISNNNGPPNDVAVAKPRARAKRGQATDPHSISERHRREKISERMKNLQELVPNSNKANKASMLDEIIEYVKFLQLQVKVLSMSRLGETGVVMPLMTTGTPSRDLGNLNLSSTATESDQWETQESVVDIEQEVVKLMESNVTAAMQFLQNRGFCLMPIALASAISSGKGSSSGATPPEKLEDICHSIAPNANGLLVDRSEK